MLLGVKPRSSDISTTYFSMTAGRAVLWSSVHDSVGWTDSFVRLSPGVDSWKLGGDWGETDTRT
jgi:hypothetical protein